jgi:hypothetical protein
MTTTLEQQTAKIVVPVPADAAPRRPAWAYALWIFGTAAFGFLVSAVFAGMLQWLRAWFLVPYIAGGTALVYAYVSWSRVDVLGGIRRHWTWALLGAALAGVFVVNNVLAQPASPAPTGLELAGALLWFGLVYGTIDALLLTILPMLAAWQALSLLGWTSSWPGRVGSGAIALAASLFVATVYHVGFPEYRDGGLLAPVIGNGVMSLASLLTMSPLRAILAHVAMHIAAVLHGMETTVQLPPHYGT